MNRSVIRATFISSIPIVVTMIYSWLLIFILIGSTLSCSCIMRPSLNEDFANTPVIFIGSVIEKFIPTTLYDNVEYTMKVEEVFKGTSVGAHIQVKAREQTAACGIGIISINDRLQVWLSEYGTTNLCTRTTLDVNRTRAELQKLAKIHFNLTTF